MRVACRSGSPSSLDTPAHHSVTNEPQELRSIGSIIREKSNVDRRRFGVTARVSLDVPIWAFGRCSRQPSWRAKRFCAGIGPLKPCVAGVYPACRKTRRFCTRGPARTQPAAALPLPGDGRLTNAQLERVREHAISIPDHRRLPLGAPRSPKRPTISPDRAEPYGISAGRREDLPVFRQAG